MDNFIDSFLSSTSWSNGNSSTSRSWIGSVASQADSLLANPMESYQRDGKISPMSLIHSNHVMENVSADALEVDHDNTPSTFADGSLKYGSSKALFVGGNLLQNQQPNLNSLPSRGAEGHGRKFSTPGPIGCNSTAVSYGAESNVALSHNALTISNSLANNGREPPAFGQSLEEAHSLPSAPAFWTPTYSNISHLSSQEKVENFSFQGMANGPDYLSKGGTELPNLQLPSFTGGSQLPFSKTIGMLANQQPEGTTVKQQMNHSSSSHQQMAQTNSAPCNVATKPRVRARRGQATDPHSIAERLRREKIAERMKNLQELVPNSNKTDKASMLDEIIDYVKFLQLQVKVLSMSRLGGAGAVVPLITDAQTEDTGSLHPSTVSQGLELLESQDNLAFEHEVVKLMESNVTSAMQFLQNKGLCLMPIALASAISIQKGSIAAIPPDRRQPDVSERSDHGDEVVIKREEEPKSIGNGRHTKL